MKRIIALVLSTLFTSISAHAETDLEALYQSVIPKSSECYSAKLENATAADCNASCGEAVVNLRLLVNGIPQPLPEKVKAQVTKCESDYAAYKTTAAKGKASESSSASAKPKSSNAVANSKKKDQEAVGDYTALKTELAGLGKTCADIDQNRHTKICIKLCKEAILDLQKINSGDANINQAMKNARGDVEKLPNIRQCRLRHKLSTR